MFRYAQFPYLLYPIDFQLTCKYQTASTKLNLYNPPNLQPENNFIGSYSFHHSQGPIFKASELACLPTFFPSSINTHNDTSNFKSDYVIYLFKIIMCPHTPNQPSE